MLPRNRRFLLSPAGCFSSLVRGTQTDSRLPTADAHLKTLCGRGLLREALLEMGLLGAQLKCKGYDALLTECMNYRAVREGQRVHAHMIKSRYVPSVYLANRVIGMYVKCGELGYARKMLEAMPKRSVASWTAVISGCSQGGHSNVALKLFVDMMREGTVHTGMPTDEVVPYPN